MEKENYIIKMEILNMTVFLLVMNLKDMENIFGKITIIIQGNGKTEIEMEKENYIIKMEILNMKAILLVMNLKDMENIFGNSVIIIQDNGKIV